MWRAAAPTVSGDRHGAAIAFVNLLEYPVPRLEFHLKTSGPANFPPNPLITCQHCRATREILVARRSKSGDSVPHDVAWPSLIHHHRGNRRGHRLLHYVPERVRSGGEQEHITVRVCLRQRFTAQHTGEYSVRQVALEPGPLTAGPGELKPEPGDTGIPQCLRHGRKDS